MSKLGSTEDPRAMPALLRFLTILGFCTPLFVFGSLHGIRVYEAFISGSRWWASGGGYVLLVAAIAMFVGAYGMNRRSKWGLTAYIAGSAAIGLAGMIAMQGAQISVTEHWYVIAGQFVLTAAIALYLCLSGGVKRYFCCASIRKKS